MAKQGARFEVKRDYTLTEQHYKMLQDNRATIERVSNITSGFMGKKVQQQADCKSKRKLSKAINPTAHVMDNFRSARTQIGELLMAMIIEDIIHQTCGGDRRGCYYARQNGCLEYAGSGR